MSVAQKRERILSRLIEDEMREAFLDYSMSVIVQRALPDVRDGLKPVHRRILHAMRELGLVPDRPHKKSATVVGEVLGKYHPHGDAAVYETMVRMVQDFSLRYPLVDGQGNFGSIDGDSAAAYRYTEAKLSAISITLLNDLERETVDWSPNFDGRLLEPTVLPGPLPNLLVNGSSGIAVGMSTNIPPHNLAEVTAAFRLLAAEPECTVEQLMEHLPGPDLPTGGFLVGTEGIREMYATGRGRLIMRARIVKEALRGGKEQLVVVELPYGISKSRIIEQIVDLSRKGKLEDVSDVRDESDREGMRLVIELKRGAKAGKTMKALLRSTYLQATFGAILLALDGGEPREFNLKELLERYRDHRLEVIVRRSRHDLEKAEAERHILEGLLLALDRIDEVIRIIRGSRDRGRASTRLQSTFGLSELQADAILNMRLARLTSLEGEELRGRMGELDLLIAGLREILGSEAEQLRVVLAELDAVTERFGDRRRTVILEEGKEFDAPVEDAVADEDVVVTLTRQGFIKSIPMHLYKRRVQGGRALAEMDAFEDDWMERVFTARTKGWLLAFTEQGRAHFLSVLDIPEPSRSSRGQSLYALTGADRGDRIVSVVPVESLDDAEKVLLFVSEGGTLKRTKLAEFQNPRAGGIIAAGVKEGDRILEVVLSDERAEVILLTREGRSIRFEEREVPVVGRTAQGVKGIDLKGDDGVVGVVLIRREASVLTLDEGGYGKRTSVSEFPLQKRGGMGTLALPAGEGSRLVGALEVVPGDRVTVVLSSGAISHIEAEGVSEQGRRTRGGKLVELAPGESVVELTRSIESGGGRTSEEAEATGGDAEEGSPEEGSPEPNENVSEAIPEAIQGAVSEATSEDRDSDDTTWGDPQPDLFGRELN